MIPHNTVKDAERSALNEQIEKYIASGEVIEIVDANVMNGDHRLQKKKRPRVGEVLEQTIRFAKQYRKSSPVYPDAEDLCERMQINIGTAKARLNKLASLGILELTENFRIKKIL